MENILNGCFYDDVVITGKNNEEVTDRLLKVLKRFESARLTNQLVKASNCTFLQGSVTFSGHNVIYSRI